MASFQFQGVCYPSENDALGAFNSYFFNSGSIVYTVQSSSVNSSGLISYYRRASDGSVNGPASFQLSSCSELTSSFVFDKMPVQDMIFAGVLVLVFVIGIFQGAKS